MPRRRSSDAALENDLSTEDESNEHEDDQLEDSDNGSVELKTSLRNTFLSIIPYTKQWRELRDVIEDLDNVTKLQIEFLRAQRIVQQVQVGEYQPALKKLLAAVNANDYDYFQRVRYDRINNGKWQNTQDSTRSSTSSTVPNRFRRAATLSLAMMRSAYSGKMKTRPHRVHHKLQGAQIVEAKCSWQPTPDSADAGFECTNMAVWTIGTKRLTSYCAWHSKLCLMTHDDNRHNMIAQPNEHGLCSMHHLAKYNKLPEIVCSPYPGMVPTLTMNTSKVSSDPLAPNYPAPEGFYMCLQASFQHHRRPIVRWFANYRNNSKRNINATKIQSTFRMFHCIRRFKSLVLCNMRNINTRNMAATKIQGVARVVANKQRRYQEHQRQRCATLQLQAWWRGSWTRRQLRMSHAASILQNAARSYNRGRVLTKNVALWFAESELTSIHRKANCIQRAWRGYHARKLMAHQRVMFVCGAVIVQKVYRKWKRRAEQTTSRIRQTIQRRQHAAKIIFKFMLNVFTSNTRLGEWKNIYSRSACQIQRIARGLLARLFSIRLQASRQKLWDFINPSDIEELRAIFFPARTLPPESLVNRNEVQKESSIAPTISANKSVDILWQFLPRRSQGASEVASAIFIQALRRLYVHWQIPLPKGEVLSLAQRFRNALSGHIDLIGFNDFANLHTTPCQKHSRRLCGDCVVFLQCCQQSCSCMAFKGKYVCSNCKHDQGKHRCMPKQYEEAKFQSNQLVAALQTERKPDKFLPQCSRYIEIENLPQQQQQRQEEQSLPKSQQEEQLPRHQASEKHVTNRNERRSDYKTTPQVLSATCQVSTIAPNDKIPREAFWKYASNLPNKSLREYQDGVAISIPTAFFEKETQYYTLDGGHAYVWLLRRIQDMSNHIDHDDTIFLQVILDHYQLFRRHWRKLVRDLRMGSLNRHAHIPLALKSSYLSNTRPRRYLAQKLDHELRLLGFHNADAKSEGMPKSFGNIHKKLGGNTSPRRQTIAITLPLSRISHGGRRRRASTGTLLVSDLSANPTINWGPERILPLAEGDTPETEPVADDSHWICPFPGCGVAFSLKGSVFSHMACHDWKTRLAIPNPHSDQFLHHIWPRSVPWLSRLTQPHGSCHLCGTNCAGNCRSNSANEYST